MTLVLLIATTACGAAEAREWVEFVGFSKDGRRAAHRKDVDVTRADGSHDQYSMVITSDVRTGYTVAAFQIAINRIDSNGRPIKMSRKTLSAQYRDYDRAYPSKRWTSLEKREKFRKVELHPDPNMIQLAVEDVENIEVGSTPDGLMMAAPVGKSISFNVMGHGADGNRIDAGTYRQSAKPDETWVARVQAFSHPGRQGLAVVVIFMGTVGEKVRTVTKVKVIDIAMAAATPTEADEEPKTSQKKIWNQKINMNNAAPKFDPANREAVDPKERSKIESVYRRFSGKK